MTTQHTAAAARNNAQAQSLPAAFGLQRVLPVLAAVLMGVLLLAGVGFAHPHVIHNATHDARHDLAFPCH